MLNVYGKPAVAVPQPDGTLAGYLIEGVTPTDPRVSRRWRLTSPKGEEYTVSECPGFWLCTCPAATRYTRHGCKYAVGTQRCCKHIFGLATELGCSDGVTDVRRPGEGLAGRVGGAAPHPDVREHAAAGDPGGAVPAPGRGDEGDSPVALDRPGVLDPPD